MEKPLTDKEVVTCLVNNIHESIFIKQYPIHGGYTKPQVRKALQKLIKELK